jgi:pyrimidine-nucleoside phosphorylase
MRILDIIAHKRDGRELTTAEIHWFIEAYTAEQIPDYQASALCMAIYLQGMSRRETVDLTLAMAASGEQLDLHDAIPFAIDKHSSGGVGDKTTLVVQPLVAACGIPVAKMSGRGLGFTGGTLDKMEAITGWRFDMDLAQFKKQVREIGLVLAGQTAALAPADGKLYALRDVTATVSSIPLIAASIMSKKLASGADAIVLDVKVGSGAFMKTVDEARELAQRMVDIGHDAGRQTVALLSDMNQPLGYAIGNALEVREAIETLHPDGTPPPDFWAHCVEVGAHMLLLAGAVDSLEEAHGRLAEARDSGRALAKFRAMVAAQGGDVAQVDDPDLLPRAPHIAAVTAPRSGTISAIETDGVGIAAMNLGAGRAQKHDPIDYAVGFHLPLKIGDTVQAGQPIATIYARTAEQIPPATAELLAALSWSDEPVPPMPHSHGVVRSEK